MQALPSKTICESAKDSVTEDGQLWESKISDNDEQGECQEVIMMTC